MKLLRTLFFLLAAFSFKQSFCQKTFPWGYSGNQIIFLSSIGSTSDPAPNLHCDQLPVPGHCTNLLSNNNFTPTAGYNANDPIIYGDPFTLGLIPFWEPAQGYSSD